MSPRLNVYALSAEPPEREVRGALGEPVRALRAGSFFALAGEVDGAPELSEDAVRAHDAAVRRLALVCPALLPVRLGSVVDELDFSARESELLEALELVRGREQMTLRVYGEPQPADRESGTAYLESLRRSHSIPALDPLRSALGPLVHAERTEPHDGPLIASVYHLIDRGTAAEYLRAVAGVALAVRVAPSGPWPAWSFAPEALR
ncbi:MAG: GvpL/GvpF family gas vesicle protein [Myxococcales bacterium]